MDIYRRSKLSEQELEALELREREVSVHLVKCTTNTERNPAQRVAGIFCFWHCHCRNNQNLA